MAGLEAPQNFFTVSGGDAIAASGNLVLCGRSDLASERFFDGKLTQLAVFNNALTTQSVGFLRHLVQETAQSGKKLQITPPQNAPARLASSFIDVLKFCCLVIYSKCMRVFLSIHEVESCK